MGAHKGKTISFVLDASVTLAWFFPDEKAAYADYVLKDLFQVAAAVPSLWTLEVGNSLLRGERLLRANQASVVQFTNLLQSLPIAIDHAWTQRSWTDVLYLARQHQHTTYDATYLELSIRLGLPLATLDKKLQAIARMAGIALYKPTAK